MSRCCLSRPIYNAKYVEQNTADTSTVLVSGRGDDLSPNPGIERCMPGPNRQHQRKKPTDSSLTSVWAGRCYQIECIVRVYRLSFVEYPCIWCATLLYGMEPSQHKILTEVSESLIILLLLASPPFFFYDQLILESRYQQYRAL